MTSPRGHHLVAQLYQRGFARRKGKAWQVRVLDRRSGTTSIRNVDNNFKRRDWNTIVDEDGEQDFGIEEALAAVVDGPAASPIAELRDGVFCADPRARHDVARFMAAQLVRGREVRENLARTMTEVQRRILTLTAQNYTEEHWMRAIGEVPSEGAIEAMADNENHLQIEPTNAALLSALLDGVDEYAEMLLRRTWTLVSLSEPMLFTGEHPVVHVPGREGSYGIATAEHFHFPVSTTRSLVLSHPWGGWSAGRVRGTVALAEQLNWATLEHPANAELLLHPDVESHPLPRPGQLLDGMAVSL